MYAETQRFKRDVRELSADNADATYAIFPYSSMPLYVPMVVLLRDNIQVSTIQLTSLWASSNDAVIEALRFILEQER